MESNWSLCNVCGNCQINKPSVVWCSECDKGLCEECEEHHSTSKRTEKHVTVYIGEYKLPTKVLQIAKLCKKHNEKYEFFCRKHDYLCCKKCVEIHNSCKDLCDINEVLKNVKTSNAFYEIEQTLLEVVENIERIITNRENNLTSLKNKKREIEAELKQTRTKINRHLDKLQDDLTKELMATEQKESSKIQKLLNTLKRKEKEITSYQANVANIKQSATDLQTFLSMKQIEQDVAVEEKFIQSIVKKDILNQIKISGVINKSLQQITASIQKFGNINVSVEPCDISIQKQKYKQAQSMIALQTRYIDNLTPMLQKRINTELSMVQGCSLLPGDRMVFSSSENKIVVFKSDSSKDFEINNISRTFDVVFIGDDSIAVTSRSSNEINIINIKINKMRKALTVNSDNDGIAYKDGNLIYCAEGKGIQMVSLNDGSITNVISNTLSALAYVTTFRNKLFYTNFEKHSVTCCDYHGNVLWVFRDTSVLLTPLGISVDKDGNLFVVGRNTDNVVVISPDAKRYRELLSHDDGLRHPRVLHYDQSTSKLLVANEANDAFVYELN